MSFAGFELAYVDLGEITTRVRYAGWGPPLLLLHSCPHTRGVWSQIAIDLSQDFTVIAPDIADDSDGVEPANAVALMAHFGFPEFYVAGHARGAQIACRLTLDHPERVLRLAVLEIPAAGETRRGGAKIRCPVQVLWATRAGWSWDPLDAWAARARDLRGEAVHARHVLAEEKLADTLAALRRFFVEGL